MLPGSTLRNSWISLQERPAESGHPVVIAISKRVIPLSTGRSRAKRLIREAIKLDGYHPPKGREWKISVRRKPPKTAKVHEVRSALKALLSGSENA